MNRSNCTTRHIFAVYLFQVDAALAPGYPDDPLVEGFRVTLKRSDIATLSNLNWLNDEVGTAAHDKESYYSLVYTSELH